MTCLTCKCKRDFNVCKSAAFIKMLPGPCSGTSCCEKLYSCLWIVLSPCYTNDHTWKQVSIVFPRCGRIILLTDLFSLEEQVFIQFGLKPIYTRAHLDFLILLGAWVSAHTGPRHSQVQILSGAPAKGEWQTWGLQSLAFGQKKKLLLWGLH